MNFDQGPLRVLLVSIVFGFGFSIGQALCAALVSLITRGR